MIVDLENTNLYIKNGYTDLRKQVSSIIENEQMNMDAFTQSIFLFCSRQRKLIRCIYWDKTGFCMWQKRLEKAKFPWPQTTQEALNISKNQLEMLLAA